MWIIHFKVLNPHLAVCNLHFELYYLHFKVLKLKTKEYFCGTKYASGINNDLLQR